MDSLRDRQISSVVQALNLNSSNKENSYEQKSYQNYLNSSYNNTAEDSEDETTWKILIFDEYCRDIVSTLLKVSDLRENGITVHMLLDSPRSKLADVPAVYFVQPTSKNIQQICEV
ncbi:hypothetical protein BB561_002148 [Smittium simulii]|uniref:Sec1-like protein n=1 Tax=Smittium simulii TaxID=133385 RepID=A0A2T9YRR4_9FUNG|nr:hypothetical protein BB561_002148 [Smittium simulii]